MVRMYVYTQWTEREKNISNGKPITVVFDRKSYSKTDKNHFENAPDWLAVFWKWSQRVKKKTKFDSSKCHFKRNSNSLAYEVQTFEHTVFIGWKVKFSTFRFISPTNQLKNEYIYSRINWFEIISRSKSVLWFRMNHLHIDTPLANRVDFCQAKWEILSTIIKSLMAI